MQRYLVTGAAGFIGSALVKRLVADGHDVVAADTFASAGWANLADVDADVATLGADRTDLSALRRMAERYGAFDAILAQGALTGVIASDGSASAGDDTAGFLRNNVEAFRALLDLAVDAGSRVVWASSCSVYGRAAAPQHERLPYEPLNVYAFSKVQCERLARRYERRLKQPIVGLRYSNVYGPGEAHKGKLASMVHQLARQMRAGQRPRVFTAGEQRRDFVYVDDVVACNLAALRASASGVYNCGAGASWSFNDVIAELNRALRTDLAPDYFANPYAFTQDHTETDMRACADALGHVPKFDLRRGIDAYASSGKLGV